MTAETRMKRVSIGCALACLLFGGSVLLGWWAGVGFLVRTDEKTIPVAINTGLCFCLTGAGVLLLWSPRMRFLPKWLGVVAAATGLITLTDYALNAGWDVNAWLDRSALPGYLNEMKATTASAFVLAGFALFLLGHRSRGSTAGLMVFIVCLALGALGGIDVLRYATRMHITVTFAAYAKMAPQTAVAFLVLAAALASANYALLAERRISLVRWKPGLAFGVGMALSFGVALLPYMQQQFYLARLVQYETEDVERMLVAEMEERRENVTQFASHISGHLLYSQEAFCRDAAIYLADNSDFKAILLLSPEGTVVWDAPSGARAAFPLPALPIQRVGTATLSALYPLEGGEIFFILQPLWEKEERSGFLVVVVDFDALLKEIGNRTLPEGYGMRVEAGGRVAYQSAEMPHDDSWTTSRQIFVDGQSWTVALWPTQSVVQRETPLFLPLLLFVLGVPFSALFGLVVHSRQVARTQQAEVRLAYARLYSVLEGAADFVAAMDRGGEFIFFNENYARNFVQLFGVHLEKGMTVQAALADFPSIRDEVVADIGRAMHGEDFLRTSTIEAKAQRVCEFHYSPLKDDTGRVTGTVQVVRDISERKALEIAYKESKEQLEIALESAHIGTWSYDLLTNRFCWDRRLSFLFGLPEEAFKGQIEDFLRVVVPRDKERVQREFSLVRQRDVFRGFDFEVARPDGSTLVLTLMGKRRHDERECSLLLTGVVWDITEPKRAQQRMHVQYAVGKVLNEAGSIKEMVPRLLQAICDAFNWPVANFWELDQEAHLLVCREVWHVPWISIPSFKTATLHTVFESGVGLPGRVWSSRKAEWISDVVQDKNFPRAPFAAADGLHAAIAFPIFDGEKIFGVIELFDVEAGGSALDSRLLELFTSVSYQVSQFFQRRMLEEARLELGFAVESTEEAIISQNAARRITQWNRGAERMFGYAASEVIGRTLDLVVPEEMEQEHATLMEQLERGSVIKGFEMLNCRKDGSRLWVSLSISPLKDAAGNLVGYCSISHDITARRQAEESLKLSEEKFRAFVETTGEWIWTTDQRGALLYSNPAIREVLGYDAESVLHKRRMDLTLAEDRPVVEKEEVKALQERRGWQELSARFLHANGSTVWLESNARPIFDAAGHVAGYQGADRDITARRELENTKKEFVAMVSHELRAPLTSIKGSLGLILGEAVGACPDKVKQLLSVADGNCTRLIRLINDILDMEKLEAGKMEFHLERLDLGALIQKGITLNQGYAAEFGVRLACAGCEEAAYVRGDPDRLMQVVTNLISNAVKFSPQGEAVEVRVKRCDGHVRAEVADKGGGISPEFQSKIFQKFAQAEGERGKKGTGLGLSICKLIVERLGGKIGFSSEAGKGATFYFELPEAAS
jgi:PAS domain S-box-containing protein